MTSFEGASSGSLEGTWVRHAAYVQHGPSVTALTGASYSERDARRIVERTAAAAVRRLPGRRALDPDDVPPPQDTGWRIPLVMGIAVLVGGVVLWLVSALAMRRRGRAATA